MTGIKYVSYKVVKGDERVVFVQVGSLVHVSTWRGDDLQLVCVVESEAARIVWRQARADGFVVGAATSVDPLYVGLDKAHVPAGDLAATLADLDATR